MHKQILRLFSHWIVLISYAQYDWIAHRCVLSSICSLGYRIGSVWGWLRYSGMRGPWRYYTEFPVTPGTIGWLKALLNEYNISGIDAVNWRGININHWTMYVCHSRFTTVRQLKYTLELNERNIILPFDFNSFIVILSITILN